MKRKSQNQGSACLLHFSIPREKLLLASSQSHHAARALVAFPCCFVLCYPLLRSILCVFSDSSAFVGLWFRTVLLLRSSLHCACCFSLSPVLRSPAAFGSPLFVLASVSSLHKQISVALPTIFIPVGVHIFSASFLLLLVFILFSAVLKMWMSLFILMTCECLFIVIFSYVYVYTLYIVHLYILIFIEVSRRIV